MDVKFYLCEHCGNLVEVIQDGGVVMVCCGQKMTLLKPNTVEASTEKHIPAVKEDKGILQVHVGSVTHPMVTEHYIQWICVETDRGCHRRDLKPGQPPHAEFCLNGEQAKAVYAYCNIHGLWGVQV